jgi:hypothetical protein
MGDSGDLLLFSFALETPEMLEQVKDRLAGGRLTTLLVASVEPYLSLGRRLATLWNADVKVCDFSTGSFRGLRDSLSSQGAFSRYSAMVQGIRESAIERLNGGFKLVLAPSESIQVVFQALGLQQSYPAALLAFESTGLSSRIVKVFMTVGEFNDFLLSGSLRESCKDFFQTGKLHFACDNDSKLDISPLELDVKVEENTYKEAIRRIQPSTEAAFQTRFAKMPKDNDRREQCEELRHQLQLGIESDLANQLRTWLAGLDTGTEQIGYLRRDMESMSKELRAAGNKVSPHVENMLAKAKELETTANETRRLAETSVQLQHSLLADQQASLSGLLSSHTQAPLAWVDKVKTLPDGLQVVAVVRFRKPYHIPCNLVLLSGTEERTLPISFDSGNASEVKLGPLDSLQDGQYRVLIRGEMGQPISQELPLVIDSTSIRKVAQRPVEGYLDSMVYRTIGNIDEVEAPIRSAGGEAALAAFRDLALKWQNPQVEALPQFIETARMRAAEGGAAMRSALETQGCRFSL